MTTITFAVSAPGGEPLAGEKVRVEFYSQGNLPGVHPDGEIVGPREFNLEEDGTYTLTDLVACTGDLEGGLYRVRVGNRYVDIQPIDDDSYSWADPAIRAPGAPGIQYVEGPPGDLTVASDLVMPDTTVTGGTATAGKIQNTQTLEIPWEYTQTQNPTDSAIGTAVNVIWDVAITGNTGPNAGLGPVPATGHFGPRSTYHQEGVLRYGVDGNEYCFTPIAFGSTLASANTAGVARVMSAGWGFMDANIFGADGATVTLRQIDTMDGAASFVDSRVFGTVNSGTLDGLTNDVEHVGFVSQPHIVGNTSMRRVVGFDVMDYSSTSPTDSNAVRDALDNILGGTADAGITGTVAERIGLRIARFTKAAKAIGILNASSTIETPAAVTISSASDTLPIDVTVAHVTVSGGATITLTSTPILADGTEGQRITFVNVGSQTLVLSGEQAGSTLAATANTNIAETVRLAPGGSATLRWSTGAGRWIVAQHSGVGVELGAGTLNLYSAQNRRYPELGMGSFFGVAYVGFGAGGSSDMDAWFSRSGSGALSVGSTLGGTDGVLQAGNRRTINAQTGTAYVMALADQARTVHRTNASASTMTWPGDTGTSAAAIPAGCWGHVLNLGAGTITHSAVGNGVLATGSDTSQTQGQVCTWFKTATNTFLLSIT